MLDPAKFKSGGLPWNRLKSQTIGDGCLKVTDAQMERVMGIEPTSKAWEAFVLPLNYTRTALELTPSTEKR